MEEASSLPLLSQYSDTFTRLHEGKLSCVELGMQGPALNRFVLDAARSTSTLDVTPLLSMVDPDKVEGYDTIDAKMRFCETRLRELVSLQEEVNTLQKVARQKGIAGGLLNIVGHASIQSPHDHGASVIHQLSALMGAPEVKKTSADDVTDDSRAVTIETQGEMPVLTAANDAEDLPAESDSFVVEIVQTLQQNWQALSVDVAVCAVASFFAIGLVG